MLGERLIAPGLKPSVAGGLADELPPGLQDALERLNYSENNGHKNQEGPARFARYKIEIDPSRDALLPECSRKTLNAQYLLPGETFQECFARAAVTGSDDIDHARRLYDIFSTQKAMPATPGISNLGAPTGLPISCFLNEVQDSIGGIVRKWNENIWFGVHGGGSGSYWGNVRSISESIGDRGETSGVISFLKVQDALCMCISQGGLRKAMNAAWLPIWHPEIRAFIKMRTIQGGDSNRKAINMHHGVCIPDEFMEAVRLDKPWNLISPKTGQVIEVVSARAIWIDLLTARMEQGEPYIMYVGNVNSMMPWYQANYGLTVKTSNLCAEITLPTGVDHHGIDRTAVCCLASFNLAKWEEYEDDPQVFEDVFRFIDNMVSIYLKDAPASAASAVYSAFRERSIGAGFMGWHDFLQKRMLPYESVAAMAWARRIDNRLRSMADKASYDLAIERGPCPDAAEAGVFERFACKIAIAPTASISLICGGTSPGNETWPANSFLQKTKAGSFSMRNPTLQLVLRGYGMDKPEVWSDITTKKGSVQHLDFLTPEEKSVFKTAIEIDHRWTVRLAALRSGVCQSQSTNIYLPADIHKRDLHNIHFLAWVLGVKTLYYCRSLSLQRADAPSRDVSETIAQGSEIKEREFEECLACQ